MTVKTGGEFWIGLTDVPVFIAALVFAFLIRLKGNVNKNRWCLEYTVIAAGALLGSVAHCFEMTPEANREIWVVLYLLMFALVWLFFSLMYETLNGKTAHRAWLWSGAACYAAASIIKIFIGHGDIYMFVAYAVPSTAVLIAECIRHGSSAAREKLVMILLGLAIACQAASFFLGSIGVVVAHMLVFAAMLALYDVAKDPNGALMKAE